MKNKLKFLTLSSLRKKTRSKWFVTANVLLALLIICLINIDSIIKLFGGDFNEKQIIYVNDKTNITYDILKKQNDAYKSITSEENNFEIKRADKTEEEIFKEEKKSWYLEITKDETNYIKAKITSEGYISSIDYAAISSIMNNVKSEIALNESDIDKEELTKISAPITIERQILDKNKKSESESTQMIMSTVFPVIILPFFALTIFLVQMVGAEINDEKKSRSMEIIISNVSPKTHLMSKVLASNIFVLLQGALLIIFAVIGIVIRMTMHQNSLDIEGLDIGNAINTLLTSDVLSNLAYIIPLAFILMILTFIAYSLLAGVLASMTTSTEDFQQLQTPIMIISLVGYYLAIMAGLFEGSTFIKIISFVPFISAILAPSLLILGQIGITEFLISIILVILTIFLLIKYGLKIYKVGILNYSSKGLWKKMFKALKE